VSEIERLPPRFLLLEDVARELATSNAQVYSLVRSKALPAIKIGGRGQWRIERTKLEEFIARAYDDTSRWIDEHPFGSGDSPEGEDL
jgi:excisionase family DNA binding protein